MTGHALPEVPSPSLNLINGCLVQAISDADAITTPKHPRAVPLLQQLGIVFARTSRVTYAEGIFRCLLEYQRTFQKDLKSSL